MSEALIEHLRDLFAPLGPISTRAMFGGHGVYFEGLIVGVIIGEALYLKTDEDTREAFRSAGCQPFVYEMKGRSVAMSYWSLPESALDSPESMQSWARLAIGAASRKAARGPARRRAG